MKANWGRCAILISATQMRTTINIEKTNPGSTLEVPDEGLAIEGLIFRIGARGFGFRSEETFASTMEEKGIKTTAETFVPVLVNRSFDDYGE